MNIVELFQHHDGPKDEIKQPYLIAEAGVNHEGDMETAKRLIREAKEGGADAIKFQTYKADTLASRNSPSYWDLTKESTTSQHQLFQKYDSFWKNEFEVLKKYADEYEIEFMSTPFDVESATFLNDLMPVFKISSSDITNMPFIQFMCSFNKPIILSTGGSYFSEVEDAVRWVKQSGDNPLSLLHCILNYPTENQNANLAIIRSLKQKYPDKIIGYSDHTLPADMRSLEVAYQCGAVILEKHFTHDKSLPGNDHYHAMDWNDIKTFKSNLGRVVELMGSSDMDERAAEAPARQNARRSLVAKRYIPAGKAIDSDDLTWKRPAFGIGPKYISEVIGKTAAQDIEYDAILKWSMIRGDE